jgi:hypothetical protein
MLFNFGDYWIQNYNQTKIFPKEILHKYLIYVQQQDGACFFYKKN